MLFDFFSKPEEDKSFEDKLSDFILFDLLVNDSDVVDRLDNTVSFNDDGCDDEFDDDGEEFEDDNDWF